MIHSIDPLRWNRAQSICRRYVTFQCQTNGDPIFSPVGSSAPAIDRSMCFAIETFYCSFALYRYPDSNAPETVRLLPSMHDTFDGSTQPIAIVDRPDYWDANKSEKNEEKKNEQTEENA